MTILLLLPVCVVAGLFCAIPVWFACHGWRPAWMRAARGQPRHPMSARAYLEPVALNARLMPADDAEASR